MGESSCFLWCSMLLLECIWDEGTESCCKRSCKVSLMRGGLSCQGWDRSNLTIKCLPLTKYISPLLKRKEPVMDDLVLSKHKSQIRCWQWSCEKYLMVRHVFGYVYEKLVLEFSKLYVRDHIHFRTWFWTRKTPNHTSE